MLDEPLEHEEERLEVQTLQLVGLQLTRTFHLPQSSDDVLPELDLLACRASPLVSFAHLCLHAPETSLPPTTFLERLLKIVCSREENAQAEGAQK